MADELVLEDASGPVAPRFAHTTRIVLTRTDAGASFVRDHKDASGAAHTEGTIDDAAWAALVAAFTAVVPLGTTLDLVGDKAGRKGVAENHATLTVGDRAARLVYLSSQLDEDDGDARARTVVDAVRAAAR